MTALALIPHDNCPDCGAILRTRTVAEPALLRHGGYGATRETTTRVCDVCGWSHVPAAGEVAP